MNDATMKAAVIHEAGDPEVLQLENIAIPRPLDGQVLIRVKAFGLNRSELFTRRGLSPKVQFPRVLGIEAVGVVESAPGGEFAPGDVVATAMGGMGREFDGGYAEFTSVPVTQVQKLSTQLDWATLGPFLRCSKPPGARSSKRFAWNKARRFSFGAAPLRWD